MKIPTVEQINEIEKKVGARPEVADFQITVVVHVRTTLTKREDLSTFCEFETKLLDEFWPIDMDFETCVP